MRSLLASLALHACIVLLLSSRTQAPTAQKHDHGEEASSAGYPATAVVLVDDHEVAAPNGGGHAGAGGHAARAGHAVHADPWGQLSIGVEGAAGNGSGEGRGGGHGRGIGFGEGGGIARIATVPLPPVPPPPSRARPAKLIFPSRDREVEDSDDLFVARVTVDSEGSVVAVHMLTSHPGVRGDQASSAIWTFRYAPALDDAGDPVRSTFEQPFQIR